MMLSHANLSQGLWVAGSGGHEQAHMQRAQIETSIKPVRKCSQISGGIFTEVERVMAPAQARFEVAENRIDPLELWQFFRFACADHSSFMDTTCGRNRAEAG